THQVFAGRTVAGRRRTEGRLLGQDIQRRGAEALADVAAQLQVLQRLPAQRKHRGEITAVVAVLLVTAGDVHFDGVDDREQGFDIGRVALTATRSRVAGRAHDL